MPLVRIASAFGLVLCLKGWAGGVTAQDRSFVDRYGAEHTAGESDKEAKSDPLDADPLFAVVSIADQRISVYGSAGLLARAPVSTGMRGHATPTGVFSIVQKRRWHTSNIYSGAPMPFMQRVTWSGIALHAGALPGYPASHGCIRLPGSFAQRLFKATEVGQRVIIAPSDAAPVAVVHANLPAPKWLPDPGVAVSDANEAPDATISDDAPGQNDGAVLEQASLQNAPTEENRLNPNDFARAMKARAKSDAKAAGQAAKAARLEMARKTRELRLTARKLTAAESAAKAAASKIADAIRRLEDQDGREAIAEAAEAKTKADAALAETVNARDARLAKAEEKRKEAGRILAESRENLGALLAAGAANTESQGEAALEAAYRAAEHRIAEAAEAEEEAEMALAELTEAEDRRVAKAKDATGRAEAALTEAETDEEARLAAAAETKAKAEAALTEARQEAEAARLANDAAQREWSDARKAAAEARAAGVSAARAIAEAERRLKPLSVFISRKTARLYVRQDFEPLFDAPVSIRDTERPIGTHIYVSTHAEDGGKLHWQAVTMPVAPAKPPRKDSKHSETAADSADMPAESAPIPETAQGALGRVIIPEDVSQRLSELAWVGASVIISDYGISGETGATTDFIVLTRPGGASR
jgi:hypothetical protein